MDVLFYEDLLSLQDARDTLAECSGRFFGISLPILFSASALLVLPGDLMESLGEEARASALRMTMKGKRVLRALPKLLQDASCMYVTRLIQAILSLTLQESKEEVVKKET